jgi:hypothetical protein
VDALLDGSLTPATRNAVGAVLVCHEQLASRSVDKNWRSFTLSAWWADRSMQQAKVKSILNNYGILKEDYPLQVQTPLGEKYDCTFTGMN